MADEAASALDAESLAGANEVSDNAKLREYLRTGGVGMNPRDLAWCAGFINATLAHEGVKGTGSLMAGSFLSWGRHVDPQDVAAGDVLVKKDASHVGMAEGSPRMGPNGLEVLMVAGNERDRSGNYSPAPGRSQVGKVGERWVPLSEFEARRSDGSTGTTAIAARAPDHRRPDDRIAKHGVYDRTTTATRHDASRRVANRGAGPQGSGAIMASPVFGGDNVPFTITTTVTISPNRAHG